MNAAPLFHDYRDQMQGKALEFLRRHQAEHLGDDAQLIERTTQHLVHSWDVPLFLAPRLVALAISELRPQPYRTAWIGLDLASGPDSIGRHHLHHP